MKKVFVLILLGVILLAACNNGGQVLDNKKEKEVIKIGAPLALSGNGAYYGIQSKNGIDLALEEINGEDNNFKIEIVYEDTKGDPRTAVAAVSKLVNVDGIKTLLGPTRSVEAVVVAPVAEKAKVIMFLSSPSAEEITNAGDYIFRNRETGKLHGEVMAEFLAKGGKKTAIIIAQAQNSFTYRDSFMERFTELNGEIVFDEQYNDKQTDFKTLLIKAKSFGAEAVYTAGATYKDVALLVKQIREMGFDGLIVGSPAMGGEDFLELAGESAEGVIATFPDFDVNNPKISDYVNAYKAKYGEDEENSFFAANAYDAVKILAGAIEYCSGDRNTDCIRDYLYQVKDYPGVGGMTSFDENGDVIKPLRLKVVREGKFVKYEEE